MKSKIFIVVFVLTITLSYHISAQSTGEKINKTTQDINKAEDVVIKGKGLMNIFKKKNKPENNEVGTNENVPNNSNEDQKIVENEEQPNLEAKIAQEDKTPLTKEATALFKNSVSKTTNSEKNEITAFMNVKVTPDETQFYSDDEYYRDYPFTIFVYPIDINHDGVEEVALVYGHMAISGDNVISTLFIKDVNGHYNANFGFTGSLIILPNSSKGFPNIALGGPGFEFPVWHWDGKNYTNYGEITNDELEKSQPLFLEEASKLYVKSISN